MGETLIIYACCRNTLVNSTQAAVKKKATSVLKIYAKG